MSFLVHVVDENDEPWEGVEVALEFHGLDRGMSEDVFTDEDGMAEFEDYEEGSITVFLDGEDFGEYYYEDGTSITLMLPGEDE